MTKDNASEYSISTNWYDYALSYT